MSAIANRAQAEAWNGGEGEHWSSNADRYDRAVAGYHEALLDVAGISSGEAVLDIGCGCGQSTIDAGRAAGAGRAVGIDLSRPMLQMATDRSRDAGITNVTFIAGDAQVHEFDPASFDIVISRFGAMFFEDLGAAFVNIGSAVRQGGRLAMVSWSSVDRNEWLAAIRSSLAAGRELPEPRPGAPGPFGLGDPDLTCSWLRSAGFGDVELNEVRADFVVGVDADDAFEFMRQTGPVIGLTESLAESSRAVAFETLRETMAAHETMEGVTFGSSALLITATRGA
jgi:SAM-dependent methyltransferase